MVRLREYNQDPEAPRPRHHIPYRYASAFDRDEVSTHQFTQNCTITASIIDAVNPNTLEVTAVGFRESSPGNALDDCSLRDIILFYKVDVKTRISDADASPKVIRRCQTRCRCPSR